jgi:RHS repeat-associated protein
VSYRYTFRGALASRTDRTGTTTFSYDHLGDLTAKSTTGASSCPNVGTVCYGYDPVGQMISSTDGGGTTTYDYDAAGEVSKVSDPLGTDTVFAYNSYHRRTDTWIGASGYGFDATTGKLSANPTSFGLHSHADLDHAGHLLQLTNTGASGNLTDQSFDWGTADASCTGGSSNDHQNQRASMTDGNAGNRETVYCYDNRGRLTSATTAAGGAAYSYGYDLDGNITADPAGFHSYNPVDQLTDTGYVYDADGNQIEGPAGDTFEYNGVDQTVSIIPSGSSAIAMSYTGTSQSERITAGNLTYTNGLAGLQSQTPTTGDTRYFVRDPGGTLLATFTRSSGGSYGSEYLYYYDGLGNIAGLTTTTGTAQAHYEYDPYGNHLYLWGSNTTLANANPYRYKGEYQDTATGLYKMGARYYNPTIANWTQRDSRNTIGNPNRANRYAAFGDDPVNNFDPSGSDFLDDVGDFFTEDIPDAAEEIGEGLQVGAAIGGLVAAPLTGGLSLTATAGVALGLGATSAIGGALAGDSTGEILGGAALSAIGFGTTSAIAAVGGDTAGAALINDVGFGLTDVASSISDIFD